MVKIAAVTVLSVFLLLNLSGCVPLVAGAAGGAGTAVWLGGKLGQEVNASMEKCQKAATRALESLNLKVVKETAKEDVIQIISNYNDGRTIWIDIRPLTLSTSKIEVRVGAAGDKDAARKILNRIAKYL
ncbi:MAG: DUF3568 family protein [Candidatus Omnitrophica bacterium]|nr:DUF3568 family protein [Candidatus Omnitrophota bacterium]